MANDDEYADGTWLDNSTTELNYDWAPPAVSPLVEGFNDKADQEAFVALQEKNEADGNRLSERMADRGVPESKRPI